MTVFTEGGQTRRGKFLEDFEAPLSDVLGATAAEAWLYSPSSSLARQMELSEAMEGPRSEYSYWGGVLSQGPRTGPRSRIVPADEARGRVKEAGFDLKIPDDGIPEAALDVLMDRKREELRRRDTFARAPSGFGPSVLQFGTALGVSLLDPINVASAFVPIYGPARYAKALEGAGGALGRAGVRARVGAVEGAVGAALVEPIVYFAATAEQADYDLTDSMTNIAFGTLLGGGLHMGAGAISDALSRGVARERAAPMGEPAQRVADMPLEARQGLGRTAIAQAVSGRQIDVESLAAFHESAAAVRPQTIEQARAQSVEALRAEFRAELLPEAGNKLSREQIKQLEMERADLSYKLGAVDDSFRETAKRLQRDQGMSRKKAESTARQLMDQDRAALRDRLARVEEQLRRNEIARAAEADLSRLEQGAIPDRFKERLERDARQRLDFGRRAPVSEAVSAALRGGHAPRIEQSWANLRAAAERQGAPESSRMADFTAAEEARVRLAEAPDETIEAIDAELADEAARLEEVADALEIELLDFAKPFDVAIDDAEKLSTALRAAALCRLRAAA